MILNLNWTLNDENKPSPLSNFVLNLVGIYLTIIFISSILLNSLLLLVFIRYKKTRTPLNQLIMIMTIFNLIGSIQFPFVIQSHFVNKWIWSKLVCIFCGYVIYFVGCLQIYLMTAISYLRFVIIRKPFSGELIKLGLTSKLIVICLFLSIFWSTVPIFGWSYYSLEDGLVSCSVEYNEKSLNVISYNISMFIFVFIIPLGIIIATNVGSLLCVILIIFVEFYILF